MRELISAMRIRVVPSAVLLAASLVCLLLSTETLRAATDQSEQFRVRLLQSLRWTPTGDALLDSFAAASFAQLQEMGLDQQTLIVDCNPLADQMTPAMLPEEVLQEMEPQFAGDSRYWELCVWSLEHQYWQDSMEAERSAGAELSADLRHPWPYFESVTPYLERLRALADTGHSAEGGVWLVVQHDMARCFWEQLQDPHQATSHSTNYFSDLSPERQQRVIDSFHWALALFPDSGRLLSWTASAEFQRGNAAEARRLCLMLPGKSVHTLDLPFPLSWVYARLPEIGGKWLDQEKVSEEADGVQGDDLASEALLAGMVLGKPILFPPMPFGVKFSDSNSMRHQIAASEDPEWMDSLHKMYCQGLADLRTDPWLYADNWLDNIDDLAAAEQAQAGGRLTPDQRAALARVQTLTGQLQAQAAADLTRDRNQPMPGIHLSDVDENMQLDLTTHSLYSYLYLWETAAREIKSVDHLAPKVDELRRFDYVSCSWESPTGGAKEVAN